MSESYDNLKAQKDNILAKRYERLIAKAKLECTALHNEGRSELAQFIADMGQALIDATTQQPDAESVAWMWEEIVDDLGVAVWAVMTDTKEPKQQPMIRNIRPLTYADTHPPVQADLVEAAKKLQRKMPQGEFFADMGKFDLVFRPGGGSFASNDQVVGKMACGDTAYFLPGIIAQLLNAALANQPAQPARSDLADELEELLTNAYAQGATDVHKDWLEEHPSGGLLDNYPEFGEAASDYAKSVDLSAFCQPQQPDDGLLSMDDATLGAWFLRTVGLTPSRNQGKTALGAAVRAALSQRQSGGGFPTIS